MTVADRRKQEREARRIQIVEAATRVFYEKGLHEAKMRDVASEARLGKGTLYLYFKTKEELVLAICVRHQRAMLEIWERVVHPDASGIMQLKALLRGYTKHMGAPIEHLKMVMSRWATGEPFDHETRGGEEMRANIQRIFTRMVEVISKGQSDGSLRDDVPPAKLAIHILSAVNGGLLVTLKLQCLPADNPFLPNAPSIDEHIDLMLDAARPNVDQTPLPVSGKVLSEEAG
jgi:AcrR family transcriptional regulator